MENRSVRILLVEDNRLDACLVREMLTEAGSLEFELIEADRLSRAMRCLEGNSFDAVLLDLSLPDGQGMTTFTAFRDVARDIPIVVLTGLRDESVAVQALQHGAQDYLIKGQVDANLLTRAIRHAIERKRLELDVRQLAQYDSLTNLPNRVLFFDRLNQALSQARRNNRIMGILFLDLDHFKSVNDSLGHSVGDRLLKEAANRMTRCLRGSDSVARLGGDEFGVLLPEIVHSEDVNAVAQRIFATLGSPFIIDENELFISTSIGACIYPNDGMDAETLIRNADTAMYRSKQEGRDNLQFYSPSMNVKAANRLALGNSLRRALEREEFLLFYQPQVDLETGRIFGVEALVRWLHPQWGLVSPAEFIPIAEETGLILHIGEWILHSACAQNKAWQAAGLPHVRIAVNLSNRQFNQKNLLSTVTQALKETDLESRFLELELTESGLMQTGDAAILSLRQFKEMGVRVSIDDFGTGYSSLRYLKSFEIDALKIDKSFVDDLLKQTNNTAIVKSIIALADNLRLDVIAEGVETIEQATYLRSLGCDRMQGYYFGRPAPAEELAGILGKQEQWSIPVSNGQGGVSSAGPV